jgi:hypothetical protein
VSKRDEPDEPSYIVKNSDELDVLDRFVMAEVDSIRDYYYRVRAKVSGAFTVIFGTGAMAVSGLKAKGFPLAKAVEDRTKCYATFLRLDKQLEFVERADKEEFQDFMATETGSDRCVCLAILDERAFTYAIPLVGAYDPAQVHNEDQRERGANGDFH